jgi:KDO2-lipid IV(A) lauroyltransferase
MKWLLEIIFRLAALLPARCARASGSGIGFLLDRVFRFRRNRITEQLQQAFPELMESEIIALRRRIYRHFGLLAMEILRLPCWSNEKLKNHVCICHDLENMRNATAKGKGVLVLAAHMGNWEVGLSGAAANGVDTHAVTKEIKGQLGQYVADRMRYSHGVRTIPRRDSIRDILRVLKKGGALGFVLDQNMTSDEGIFVDFFGRPACTMPGLAVLAQRSGAPVIPVQFWRDNDGVHHHIRFLPEVEWEEASDNRDENVHHNTQRYTKILEDLIRQHPEQWLWMHRRWRTQPEHSS